MGAEKGAGDEEGGVRGERGTENEIKNSNNLKQELLQNKEQVLH